MDPKANKLIAGLPERLFQQWLPHLEAIDMPSGLVLQDSACESSHAYFPITSMVSLMHVSETGESIEVAVVGSEGVVGIAQLMGGQVTNSRAVVSSSGHGFRLEAKLLKALAEQGGPAMQLMLRYAQALVTQMTQTAACNRHHTVEQRLCRSLLFGLDRSSDHAVAITPNVIASALGTGPARWSEAALALQSAGLITIADNHIAVVDRPALERHCCECYAVVKKEYDRLLPAGTTSV